MQTVSAASLQQSQAAPKRKKATTRQPEPSPELMDKFTAETAEQQQKNLAAEHMAQLETQARLHQDRIAALWAQLHTQLFAIWNEVWLQRQKVFDDSFKTWLKLLMG